MQLVQLFQTPEDSLLPAEDKQQLCVIVCIDEFPLTAGKFSQYATMLAAGLEEVQEIRDAFGSCGLMFHSCILRFQPPLMSNCLGSQGEAVSWVAMGWCNCLAQSSQRSHSWRVMLVAFG